MPDISPQLIAAVLLTQFVLAQHVGLRKLVSLREAIGVGATIIVTTPIAALIDQALLHAVLQPFAITYLRLLVAMIVTAATAPLVEVLLRARFASWFPPLGTLSPLAMTTCCTLVAAQIARAPHASLQHTLFDAIGLSLGAGSLLVILQGLRERHADILPRTRDNIASDTLHAAFIFIALCGVLSIGR